MLGIFPSIWRRCRAQSREKEEGEKIEDYIFPCCCCCLSLAIVSMLCGGWRERGAPYCLGRQFVSVRHIFASLFRPLLQGKKSRPQQQKGGYKEPQQKLFLFRIFFLYFVSS